MKSTKIIKTIRLALVACLVSFSAGVFAQNNDSENQAKLLTDKMKTQLTLNEEQYKKVYAVNTDFLNKAKELKNDGSSRMSKFSKAKSMDNERDKALKAILSEDQFTAFQEFKKENRSTMKENLNKRKN